MRLSWFAVLGSEKTRTEWLGSSGVWGFRSVQFGQAVALMVRLTFGQIRMVETGMLSLLASLNQSIRWGLREPGSGGSADRGRDIGNDFGRNFLSEDMEDFSRL